MHDSSAVHRPKRLIVIMDGAADEPQADLGGRTPLQAARMPHSDAIAREGICGLARTIPEGMDPGSDIATLSILGYDPRQYHSGRNDRDRSEYRHKSRHILLAPGFHRKRQCSHTCRVGTRSQVRTGGCTCRSESSDSRH